MHPRYCVWMLLQAFFFPCWGCQSWFLSHVGQRTPRRHHMNISQLALNMQTRTSHLHQTSSQSLILKGARTLPPPAPPRFCSLPHCRRQGVEPSSVQPEGDGIAIFWGQTMRGHPSIDVSPHGIQLKGLFTEFSITWGSRESSSKKRCFLVWAIGLFSVAFFFFLSLFFFFFPEQ